jgi:hypothetical protein
VSRPILRIVVLDGLDWEWCLTHADEVPELWSIADGGCSAALRSCEAPITPTAVGALLAGREVDVPWVLNDHFATSQELIRTRPWIHDLARAGLTLGLANVPLTWPAFPVPAGSWVVSGFPVVNPNRWTYPSGLDVLGYPIAEVCNDLGTGGTKNLAALRATERDVTEWYLNRAPRCDVEILWFVSTDRAGHHYWGRPEYGQAVRDACALLPGLREGCENLLVLSDHGFDALSSPRCGAYHRTTHGPTAARAGLPGGHAMEGVLLASGDRIAARGTLPEQRLVEVAGGIFDLLQLPPPALPGFVSAGPAWARAVTSGGEGDERVRDAMRRLGYLS